MLYMCFEILFLAFQYCNINAVNMYLWRSHKYIFLQMVIYVWAVCEGGGIDREV